MSHTFVSYSFSFAFDNGDMSSPKRHVLIALIFILKLSCSSFAEAQGGQIMISSLFFTFPFLFFTFWFSPRHLAFRFILFTFPFSFLTFWFSLRHLAFRFFIFYFSVSVFNVLIFTSPFCFRLRFRFLLFYFSIFIFYRSISFHFSVLFWLLNYLMKTKTKI